MITSPLRILIATFGSHGDVLPFFAVARTLRSRGHEVIILAPATFEALASRLDLGFVALGTEADLDRMADTAGLWGPMRGYRVLGNAVASILDAGFNALAERHQPGRTVVVAHWLVLAARVAQEKLNIPTVTVQLAPAQLRSAVLPASTPPLAVSHRYPAWRNRMWFALIDALLIDPSFARPLNAFRKRHGLPPVKRIFHDWIHSPDRVIGLFPPWFALAAPDWPPQTVLTGFPLYDEAETQPVDAALDRFLREGEPPIAFTAGTLMRHARDFFEAAITVCRTLDRRGVILSLDSRHVPEALPARMIHCSYAPFSRLLPRCAAIVHHGGIGTVAQALAAGIPQLAISRTFDQADNGVRLERLGVGRKVAAHQFNAASGATMLAGILDEGHAALCARVKRRFAGIDPLTETAQWIERTFADKRP